MTRSHRLFRAHAPARARTIRIAAPAAAAATLLFYFLRAAKRRRSEIIPVPQSAPVSPSDTIHDDPDFWEGFDAPSAEEEQVSHSPGPLIQLEASLAETNKDEEIAREGSRAPVPVEFVRRSMTLPAPEIDAPHRSFYLLRPSTWRLPIRFRSGRITKGNLMARLAASPRLLGRHRFLNGLALFLTATLVAYVLAGGMHRPKHESRDARQLSSSRSSTMLASIPPREPYAISTTPRFERASEPPPPAEGPAIPIAPAPSTTAQPSPSSKSNGHVAQTHRSSRHRVTSFDKARAFFRRLF